MFGIVEDTSRIFAVESLVENNLMIWVGYNDNLEKFGINGIEIFT